MEPELVAARAAAGEVRRLLAAGDRRTGPGRGTTPCCCCWPDRGCVAEKSRVCSSTTSTGTPAGCWCAARAAATSVFHCPSGARGTVPILPRNTARPSPHLRREHAALKAFRGSDDVHARMPLLSTGWTTPTPPLLVPVCRPRTAHPRRATPSTARGRTDDDRAGPGPCKHSSPTGSPGNAKRARTPSPPTV